MKLPDISTNKDVRDLVNRALAEDLGVGDITSIALVKKSAASTAAIISRGNYIVSGSSVAACVFRSVDRSLKVEVAKEDGQRIMPGRVIMEVTGSVRALLTAERTALNFLQRMTGIATLTSIFVQKTKQYGVTILDTRKTTPTLRSLEKYAGRARTVHLKEFSSKIAEPVIGQGEVKWKKFFKLCETVGATEWYIVEQEKYPMPPLDSARACIDFLKGMGK